MVICTKSELDLFSTQPIQSSITKTEEVGYKSIAPLENNKKPTSIEFVVPGQADTYKDLSSINLKLKLRLSKKDGTLFNHNIVGVSNNILHSLFRQCSVYLNGKAIAQTDVNYNYRAYIETLLSYGHDASHTHLSTIGWHMDTGDDNHLEVKLYEQTPEEKTATDKEATEKKSKIDSDATLDADGKKVAKDGVDNELKANLISPQNIGLQKRRNKWGKSAIVELQGRLHCDLFNQGRLLLNNVELKIVLSTEDEKFYIMELVDGDARVEFLDATLYVNHVSVEPVLMKINEKILQRGENAKYYYQRCEVKTYTVSPGAHNFSLDNIVMGKLPNLLILGMVKNESFTGRRDLNPFNFKHFKMNKFNLVINGMTVPAEPYTFDFKSYPPQCTRAYRSLFRDLNLWKNAGHQINQDFFANGSFLLIFDLTNDQSYGANACGNIINTGNIRAEAWFDEKIADTITCIVYTTYDSCLEIDKDRQIKTNF